MVLCGCAAGTAPPVASPTSTAAPTAATSPAPPAAVAPADAAIVLAPLPGGQSFTTLGAPWHLRLLARNPHPDARRLELVALDYVSSIGAAPISIDGVELDGVKIRPGAALELPPGDSELTVRFSGQLPGGEATYRFQLRAVGDGAAIATDVLIDRAYRDPIRR